MQSKLIAGGAVAAALVLSSGSLALAASGAGHDGSSAQGGASQAARSARTAPTVIACDGGAQKAVKNRIVNTPFTFGEPAADLAIPGAGVAIAGPASGKDTLTVTFSGETQLTGSTGTQDWMGLVVKVDGVPIQPFTAAGDVMALSGSPTWNLHGATFCTKIGPGTHRVQAYTNLADFGTDDGLGGWIDDYTLSVEKSE
jgi:hypothetical protein